MGAHGILVSVAFRLATIVAVVIAITEIARDGISICDLRRMHPFQPHAGPRVK